MYDGAHLIVYTAGYWQQAWEPVGNSLTNPESRVRLEAIPGASSVVEVLPIPYTALAQALSSASRLPTLVWHQSKNPQRSPKNSCRE